MNGVIVNMTEQLVVGYVDSVLINSRLGYFELIESLIHQDRNVAIFKLERCVRFALCIVGFHAFPKAVAFVLAQY